MALRIKNEHQLAENCPFAPSGRSGWKTDISARVVVGAGSQPSLLALSNEANYSARRGINGNGSPGG